MKLIDDFVGLLSDVSVSEVQTSELVYEASFGTSGANSFSLRLNEGAPAASNLAAVDRLAQPLIAEESAGMLAAI